MTIIDPITTVRRYFDLLNRKDWEDHIDQFYAEQFWWEGWLAGHREFRRAFPDWHYTIKHITTNGEIVCLTGTAEGTHTGEFPHGGLNGVAPTGKKASWNEAWWMRIQDGKPMEGEMTEDGVSRLQQLGILPLPEQE